MDTVIVSVGAELLSGQCIDTNAAWLSAELGRFGVRVVQHITVGDDASDLARSLRDAWDRSDLVLITGGLGPTVDDVTREAMAAATNRPLAEHPEALAQITAMFQRWKRPVTDADRTQAQIPRGCEPIPNLRGTAPGIRLCDEGKELIALPGVPSEMKEMFHTMVRPIVQSKMGEACTRSARLLCSGMSEAKIGELLEDLMGRNRNPLIGTTASEGVITVRIQAWGANPAEAERLLDADVSEVRRRLGRSVFGQEDDTLAVALGRRLIQLGKTLATAESCTGGLLAKQLTDVPGSSAYFLRGYVTYSNEAKTALLDVPAALIEAKGAVSEAVARAMAGGCRTAAGTDLALSITGIAGPTGGTPPDKPIGLVYVGLADSERVETKRLLLGDYLTRSEIRERACKAALNLVRLRLLGAAS